MENASVPLAGVVVGGDCSVANPFALHGELFVWAEPGAVDGSWSVHARDLATGRNGTLANASLVRAVSAWDRHVAWYSEDDGIVVRDLVSGNESSPGPRIPGVTDVAMDRDQAAVLASPALYLLNLSTGSVFVNPSFDGARVHGVWGAWVAADDRAWNAETNESFFPPREGVVRDLDDGWLYQTTGLEGWRYHIPDGAAERVLRSADFVGASGGRVVRARLVDRYDRTLLWTVPSGSWESPVAWMRSAESALGAEGDYEWGALPQTGYALQRDADAPWYNVSLAMRDEQDRTVFQEIRFRAAREAGGLALVSPADAPGLVEFSDATLTLTVLAPPAMGPDEAAARLGIRNVSWEDEPDAPPLAFLVSGDHQPFALECGTCRARVARGALASASLNTATAWLDGDRLVAFRTTPWIDVGNSTLPMGEEVARVALAGDMRSRGYDLLDARLERATLVGAAEPRLQYEWRATTRPTPQQPWSSMRVVQDAVAGGLMREPDEYALDPALLAPGATTTATTPPPAASGRELPGLGALATLMAGGAAAIAWTGRASFPGSKRRRT